MEKNGIHFRELGDAVILHGRQVLYALALLVVGLLAAKLFVRLLKRVLDRFMANKAHVGDYGSAIRSLSCSRSSSSRFRWSRWAGGAL